MCSLSGKSMLTILWPPLTYLFLLCCSIPIFCLVFTWLCGFFSVSLCYWSIANCFYRDMVIWPTSSEQTWENLSVITRRPNSVRLFCMQQAFISIYSGVLGLCQPQIYSCQDRAGQLCPCCSNCTILLWEPSYSVGRLQVTILASKAQFSESLISVLVSYYARHW